MRFPSETDELQDKIGEMNGTNLLIDFCFSFLYE